MGRQHIRNGLLHVTQRKTGKVLAIPIHPDLQAVLATVPATQMTFLMTLRGKRFDPHAFTAWFAEACDKAAMSSACTFHGLRKAACRRLAEAGCTVHEIAAISGHASLHEVERYTKAADQAKLARAAMARAMAAHERVSVLWVIRNYEDDGESPTTYNIATAVYQIKPDKDGNRWVSDAQHVAVKRALEGLQRKGRIIGFRAQRARDPARDGRTELCHHWMTPQGLETWLAPPSSVMNSRLLIRPPHQRWRAASAAL
jgi:hypothetical protein